MSDSPEKGDELLPPLKISCASSNCEEGLHCFRATRRMKKLNQHGKCRSCGADLIDWERVFKRELMDVTYTFKALKSEMIRHHFWHVEIDAQAVNKALRKGKAGLRDAVAKRIRTSVGRAEPYRDGMQTPYEGDVVYYAQHGTASCCRKCIEYWHGIPRGRVLMDAEIEYLSALVMLYIEDRLPDLPEEGFHFPTHYRGGPRTPHR